MPRRACRLKRIDKKRAYDKAYYEAHKEEIYAKRKEAIKQGVNHTYINHALRYKYDEEFHELKNKNSRESMRRIREKRKAERLAKEQEEKENGQNEPT